jgi:hypothetical protein
MANKQLKRLKRTARKEKNKIVSKFMTDNWDQVLVSSVKMIRRFNFKVRFTIAMQIIFKPDKENRLKNPKPQKAKGQTQSLEKQPEITGAA